MPGLRYTAVELPGTPTLAVPDDGWTLFYSGTGNLILSRTTSPSDRVTIRWLNTLAADVCALQPLVKLGADPQRTFASWLAANKGLKLSAAIPRQFGDLGATQMDVTVVDQYACQYTSPISVAITGNENFGGFETAGAVVLNTGERLRLEAASRDGRLIVMIIEAPSATEFDAFEPLAEKALSALKFTP